MLRCTRCVRFAATTSPRSMAASSTRSQQQIQWGRSHAYEETQS
jgi:hypothetical protein